jgi:hypothetical protein
MGKTYIVYNGPMVTTAQPTTVTTSTSIKTLLQLKPAANFDIKVIEWGISFDGSAAATPGTVELIDTGTVFGTVTAFAAADVMTFDDPNAPANTAGSSGVPLNLSTTASGYTCTSEGSITTTRLGDVQLIAPTGQYVKQFPLGREFGVKAGNCLRVRVKFAAAINALCYVVFEI